MKRELEEKYAHVHVRTNILHVHTCMIISQELSGYVENTLSKVPNTHRTDSTTVFREW